MRLIRPYENVELDEFQSLPEQRALASQATSIAWACLIGGFLFAAVIVAAVIRVWR